jgi:hypothetical protein
MLSAFAKGAIEEPAEMATLELPSRTVLPFETLLLLPAGNHVCVSAALIDQKEKNLAFDVGWDRTPALFVAVYGFKRHPEKLSQLLLGLAKFLPG